jgi:uncharacterized membrane protein YebE (DUF533 family)
MKKLFAILAFLLIGLGTQAQTKVLTEEQYHTLWLITRMQADTLQLNEHEYIKLLAINRKVMDKVWEQIDQLTKQLARKEEPN